MGTTSFEGEGPWHALPPADALRALASTERGLDRDEVARRFEAHGPNVLERAERTPAWKLLWRQLDNPIVFLLVGSAVVAFALGKAIDGAVVLGAIVVNILIGFVQEARAGSAIEALSRMVPHDARVVREGEPRTVPASEIVPGDIVVLASGDRVPADVRLLAARNLQVEEAALTGESVPVAKAVEPVAPDAPVADRSSMAFGGTMVTTGTASAVVVATGGATELGRISHLLKEATELQTPLTRGLASVAKGLTFAVLAVSGVLLGIALLRGYPLADAALVAVTLAVATIPEGLPAIVTIALAIGVQRMAARKAIIRRLPAVETLGGTTVICSDKTGTLTANEMTVRALRTPHGTYQVTGAGYAPDGGLHGDAGPLEDVPGDVLALLRAAVLCSDASVRRQPDGWVVTGDPTEAALIVAAAKVGIDAARLGNTAPRVGVVPFESERQFMATLHAGADGERTIHVKGAPEVVFGRSRLDERVRGELSDAVERMAAEGMRVLAVARRAHGSPHLEEEHVVGLELLGLVGMIDPPRPEAIAALARCREAGIEAKMITGDHVRTAEAVARELGLAGPGERGVTGAALSALDDDELKRVAAETRVFARVAPEHKLRLVRALQARGDVVAMTGDGVNDAPALKQADVGVAMGITGTAVSKEAADMVLVDDNFATIVAAVEEGRRIHDNLVKSFAFVLPTNLGLGLVLASAVAFFPVLELDGARVPLTPMLPTQLLWVNLVSSVTLSLPLAFEVLEPDAMARPPKPPGTPVVGRFVLARTVLVAVAMAAGSVGLFLWEYWTEVERRGHEVALAEAQTAAVTTIVLFQVFYLLVSRTLRGSSLRLGVFSNPTIFAGIAVLLLLQAAFIYLPPMHVVFGTAAIAPDALGLAALVASVIVPLITIEKALLRKRA